MNQRDDGPRTVQYVSPRTIDGKCIIHGRLIEADGKCPECRDLDQLMEGDYLRWGGRAR